MQGFNKYYPPDYDDEKHKSLNSYRGKHALGDRARKIDEGILITRFELPFNIWCGTCNAHIGMGVRYNAEKKKIGMYYSTPIFSFRCKCHLCSAWFEIQTDPKNTRYVVVSGARQKDEDWNPEENGGYAVHDTEGKTEPVDPLVALEKTTDAQTNLTEVQAPRIEQLQTASERYNADPYAHSLRVRKRFREEKKIEKQKEEIDKGIKERYGLPAELKLIRPDDKAEADAKEQWKNARRQMAQQDSSKRRKLALDGPLIPSASKKLCAPSANSALLSLRTRILSNSARRSDPFPTSRGGGTSSSQAAGIAIRRA